MNDYLQEAIWFMEESREEAGKVFAEEYERKAQALAQIAIAQELRLAHVRKQFTLPSGRVVNLDYVLSAEWMDVYGHGDVVLLVDWAFAENFSHFSGEDAEAIAEELGVSK